MKMKMLGMSLALAAGICSSAMATNMKEVITYGCRATATGEVYAWAYLKAAPLLAFDDDVASLAGMWAPIDPYNMVFSHGAGVSAGVHQIFFDCCWTDASAYAKGSTDYSFTGDTISMVFDAVSYREHANRIERTDVGVCRGDEVKTESGYEVPQDDALDVRVPFKLADYGYAWPIQVDFALKRGDSGPTTGSTVGVWQLFKDKNCNCKIDEGDELVAWDKWIIFPNDSYTMPTQNFEVKPGCYIMEYTYFTLSELNVDSKNCSDSVKADSAVEDKMEVVLTIN